MIGNLNTIKKYTIFKRGFTLVELLVVIAIIGILSSIVMTSLNSARVKARDAARLSDIRQIQVALELYLEQNGQIYPTDLTDTGLNVFLSSIPNDPLTNLPYKYTGIQNASGDCTSYHLGAVLENKSNPAFDGDDDADSTALTKCGSGVGFDGTNDATDRIYDIMP